MKKFISVAIAATLTLILASCANDGEDSVARAAAIAVSNRENETEPVMAGTTGSAFFVAEQILKSSGEVSFKITGSITYEGFEKLRDAMIAPPSAIVSLDFTEVTSFPAGRIPSYAFYSVTPRRTGCSNLVKVLLPDNITAIGDFAFAGTGLTTVEIPDSVQYFSGAFNNCLSLISVTIGKGVTTLADGGSSYGSFEGCSKLTDVNYTGTCAQWRRLSFKKGEYFQKYVPAATIHCSDGDTRF